MSARKHVKRFHDDTGGSVIVWVTLVLLVIIGLTGIAVDGARLFNLNSNLQEIADAAAIAGAKELDGSADAIDRAKDKAVNFLTNTPRWSDVAKSGVQIDTVKVSKTVGGPEVTDPREAVYVEVTTVVRELSVTWSALRNSGTMNTYAKATAGTSFTACASLQSFICNPWEADQSASDKGKAKNWKTKILPGQMILLTGGTKGAPGNWGLIDPPGNNNGNPFNQHPFWASMAPDACNAVDVGTLTQDVDTGNNADKAAAGMNVRFDNPVNGLTNTAAPIVIDGWANTTPSNSGSCGNTVDAMSYGNGTNKVTVNLNSASDYQTKCTTLTPASQRISCPLPRDRNMVNLGGNSWSTSLQGKGVDPVDLQAYWTNHHTGTVPNFTDPETGAVYTKPSRWQVYQMENNTTAYPTAAFTTGSQSKESAAPYCDASKPAGNITRRLINVAVVDCEYWKIKGASNSLPITTLMATFFMTEPAVDSNNSAFSPGVNQGSIYAELVKTYELNSAGSNIYQTVKLVK